MASSEFIGQKNPLKSRAVSTTIHILYSAVQIKVLAALALPVLYLLFFAVAGLFYRRSPGNAGAVLRKIAVMIPAYREDGVIVETAKDALLQDYPRELFDVIVIADSLQPLTLVRLRSLDVTVIEVRFEQSTKTKALNRAMLQLGVGYEIAVILDADNIMAKDFLRKINGSFTGEFVAMQGHRSAKNLDTPLAVLDAASEEINNHIFRKGHRAIGLSSAIIGSGMAFNYLFFKDLMSGVEAVGGFDKEIELKILRQGLKIGYDADALVYDEKIRKPAAFTHQRRRWLSAQLHYLRKDIRPALRELVTRGNMDYFDKVIQFMLPPRILLLGMVILLTIAFPVANFFLGRPFVYDIAWMMLGTLCLFVFLLSLPRSFYNTGTFRALLTLPRGMYLMLVSLLKIKGANRQFLHTEHGPELQDATQLTAGKMEKI
jgi:cellulose synthase/poly-beta-1,6-N-acetylglucosamine synthase-like glycosyltransferase